MTGTPEPGGASVRRDNGLVPEEWAVLAAVDPTAGDAVLAALALRGVAAVVESRGPAGAGAGAAEAREPRGRDLLWVDAARRGPAEALLREEFPGQSAVLPPGVVPTGTAPPPAGRPGAAPPEGPGVAPGDGPAPGGPAGRPTGPLDEDAAWDRIVAGWHRDDRGSAGPVPPWPVVEDLPDEAGEPGTATDARTAGPAGPPPGRLGGPRDSRPAADPADEHYVPPPPPPLPRLRRGTLAALAALALGVVLLFAPGLLGLRGGDGAGLVGIACVVGGVGVLVHGMRDRRSGGDGWDDGAVV